MKPSDCMLPEKKQEVFFEFIATTQKIHKLLGKQLNNHFESEGLTTLQMEILSYLEARPNSSIGEISKELFLSPSSLSQVIERFYDTQLLIRKKSVTDRRQVLLELTKKGRKLLGSLQERRRGKIETMAQSLALEDMRQVLKIHQKVLKKIGESQDKANL